jgi:shikimate dehydrogenase
VTEVGGIRATTRLFLLLGDPVRHSLSPRFQNAAIRARDLDAVYAALRCEPDDVSHLIRALCRADGGGNVTVPHKAVAADCIERPTAAVLRTGMCNTFWGEQGSVCGDNTDIEGFRAAALELQPHLAGSAVLVIGAGGAAAAAVAALLDERAERVLILNRTSARAEVLARRLDPGQSIVRVARPGETVGAHFDLIVNATSASPAPATGSGIDLSKCGHVGAALDVAYGADGMTPFVEYARSLGIQAADGTTMLLAQGAASFTRWFGGEPPVDVMRRSLGR